MCGAENRGLGGRRRGTAEGVGGLTGEGRGETRPGGCSVLKRAGRLESADPGACGLGQSLNLSESHHPQLENGILMGGVINREDIHKYIYIRPDRSSFLLPGVSGRSEGVLRAEKSMDGRYHRC